MTLAIALILAAGGLALFAGWLGPATAALQDHNEKLLRGPTAGGAEAGTVAAAGLSFSSTCDAGACH